MSLNLTNTCLWNANGKLFCNKDIEQVDKNNTIKIIEEKFVDNKNTSAQPDKKNETDKSITSDYWHKRILYIFIGVMSFLLVLMLISMIIGGASRPAYGYGSGYGAPTYY
jgi:hypothetical protein